MSSCIGSWFREWAMIHHTGRQSIGASWIVLNTRSSVSFRSLESLPNDFDSGSISKGNGGCFSRREFFGYFCFNNRAQGSIRDFFLDFSPQFQIISFVKMMIPTQFAQVTKMLCPSSPTPDHASIEFWHRKPAVDWNNRGHGLAKVDNNVSINYLSILHESRLIM